MKTVRFIAMVMLAFLYLGGMVGHLVGAAFPVVGSGTTSFDRFEGKTKDPVRPTITDCRHIPLVKSVVVPPVLAVDQPAFEHVEEFQSVSYPSCSFLLPAPIAVSCSGRSPPQG